MIPEVNDICMQLYEGRSVKCVVSQVKINTYNVIILGLGIEMFDIPIEKFKKL